MEDEVDIYADLPYFNLEDNECLAENKKISEKCAKLEKQVADLTQSLESLKRINNNLEVNISSLLGTAKAEIARKDRMIAEIRRELDNVQFRRGDYGRSTKPARQSSPRIKRDISPEEKKTVTKLPEIPDVTEFTCSNPFQSDINDDKKNNKSHQLGGIVNTVFGERLRTRILNEQEREQKQREQSKERVEIEAKEIHESTKQASVFENDAQLGLKTDSPNLEHKVNSTVTSRHKGLSLESKSSFNLEKNNRFSERNYSDRKRQLEDKTELASTYKKSRSNGGKSKYGDNSQNRSEGTRSSSKHSSKNNLARKTSTEIVAPDELNVYHVVDEYEASAENDLQINSEKTDDHGTEDRHNRVAIRLMLLAEGIDPDIEARKSAQNEDKKVVDDRKDSSKRSGEHSRSRSKSRTRWRNHRSRSRTPDEHWKNSRRQSRQRKNRYKRSRDRFERRRDWKNKDGDNLSEFSREICELKERIEHRGDDRSYDRVGKGRSLNKQRTNEEKFFKIGRSRTPDSSRSGSKERTTYRSREDKQCRRSRSKEKHKSRERRKRYSNSDEVSIQRSKIVLSENERTGGVEILPKEAFLRSAQNPETKSLLSLEDGEILDSPCSSPVKIVRHVEKSTDETVPSSCKLNLLDSDKLGSKIADTRCSLPLREIGNSQNNENPLPVEKPALFTSESNRSTEMNESLNCSKDERIENIAKFIANFSSDVAESEKDEKLSDKIIHSDVTKAMEPNLIALEKETLREEIHDTVNTEFQDKEDSPVLSPHIENNNPVEMRNVNDNNGEDEWCLIALDSPIKNYEENRKNRMIAQNLQVTEKLEPPKIVLSDEVLVKQSNDLSGTSCTEETHNKMDSKSEKIISGTTAKPLVQPIKNISKNKLVVLTSLRSTYHKGRKEIVLSDTNSEQCTKISMTHMMKSTAQRLINGSETVQQIRDDNKSAMKTKNIKKFRSKSPCMEDIDPNHNDSQKGNGKQSEDDISSDEKNSMNVAQDEGAGDDTKSTKIVIAATVARCVDKKTKTTRKSKLNNSKTDNETVTKFDGNLKPTLHTNVVKELNGRQMTNCKDDLPNTSKADVPENTEKKTKTDCKVEKSKEYEKSNMRKSLENDIRLVESVSEPKNESCNTKQKKESQQLIVSTRRRKPVYLEDSSTSSNVDANSNSFSDTVDNSEKKSTHRDTEPPNSLDANSETRFEQDDNEVQKIAASDVESELSNEIEKLRS